MVLDPRGRFHAELRGPGDAREGFDTPKCALTSLLSRSPDPARALWVTGYYGGALVPAADVLFAVGSDVLGPMGHDLVPVERARAAAFGRDHGAKQLLPLEQITRELAEGMLGICDTGRDGAVTPRARRSTRSRRRTTRGARHHRSSAARS